MRIIFSIFLVFTFIGNFMGGMYPAACWAEQEASPPKQITDFTWAAKHAIPAVVLIRVKFAAKNLGGVQFFGSSDQSKSEQDPFNDFWERFFNIPRSQGDQSSIPDQLAQGSGFLISADGYLITNSHVVHDVKAITVILQDGREYVGKLIGQDPNTDVAVVKIEATNLPYVSFGNSDELEIGQWVAAIGNPLGLQASLTVGVVSGKRRSDLDIAREEDFIQTDAAINKGNSGGPLLNMKGEVVGLNTAIASVTGGSMGIGFAVPSNMVHYIMEQLISGGSVERGYIGVSLQKIDNDLAHVLGLEKIEGALIADVVKKSPAEVAGLHQGDVILKYDQQPIDNLSAFRNKVALTKPGNTIALVVRRGKELFNTTVTVSSHPDNGSSAGQISPKLGIEVEELTEAVAQNLGYEEVKGVVVSKVYPNTPAALIGLKKGALIVSVNNVKVTSVADYRKVIKDVQQGQTVLLLIKQGAITRYITLKVE